MPSSEESHCWCSKHPPLVDVNVNVMTCSAAVSRKLIVKEMSRFLSCGLIFWISDPTMHFHIRLLHMWNNYDCASIVPMQMVSHEKYLASSSPCCWYHGFLERPHLRPTCELSKRSRQLSSPACLLAWETARWAWISPGISWISPGISWISPGISWISPESP